MPMRLPILSSLFFLVLMPLAAGAQSAAPAPSEIVVRYRSDAAGQGPTRHVALVQHRHVARDNGERWRSLQQRVEQLRRSPDVLYAEPNYLGHFEDIALTNDPLASSQYWLSSVDSGPLLALGRGAGVTVALIDTGVDLNHPDLAGSLLPNGFNFGENNTSVQDLNGHGTTVAGIIAAATNNNLGVTSLAPEAKILPIKVSNGSTGSFTSLQLSKAIDYAVDQGAKVINLSLTVESQPQLVREALQRALDRGIVVVAAAGNKSGTVEFPASMPGVIGVAATDQQGWLASFSNRGSEVAIAAPGVAVVSTGLGGGYSSGTGTSFSTPIVVAAVADMLSINPFLSADSLNRQLREHAVAIPRVLYPWGSIDAGASGAALLPRLNFTQTRLSRRDSAVIGYNVPPTGVPVNIFVSATTPMGEFSLQPDGGWAPVSAGRNPVARAYNSAASANGTLFGPNGLFGSVGLASLPSGDYVLRASFLRTDNGQPVSIPSEAKVTVTD